MYTTSPSLLQRLRDPMDKAAWDRFVELYLPLLFFHARRLGLTGDARAEFVQDVFAKLLRKVPDFRYDPAKGTFRSWLRRVCLNHWRDLKRGDANHPVVQATDAQLADQPGYNGLEQFWQQEDAAVLVGQMFRLVEKEFDSTSQTVFREVVLKGRPAEEVGKKLGISAEAGTMRKYRILRRLREELDGFLDE